MKRIIKLTEFLRTGNFGIVSIGDSPEDIIQKFGKPDGYGLINDRNKRDRHISYGNYEFFLVDDELDAIQNMSYNPDLPRSMEYQNERIYIESEFFEANRIRVFGEIVNELEKRKISYTIKGYFGRKQLRTSCGVVIDFNNEKIVENSFVAISNIEEYELIGIYYWPNLELRE